MGDYTPSKDLGAAVRFVLNGGLKNLLDYRVKQLVDTSAEIAQRAKDLQRLQVEFPPIPNDLPHRKW